MCLYICSCTYTVYLCICGECVCMYSAVLQSCMLRGLKMEMIGFNTAADAVVLKYLSTLHHIVTPPVHTPHMTTLVYSYGNISYVCTCVCVGLCVCVFNAMDNCMCVCRYLCRCGCTMGHIWSCAVRPHKCVCVCVVCVYSLTYSVIYTCRLPRLALLRLRTCRYLV